MDYVENDRNRKIITLCPGCSNEMSSAGADAVHIVDIYHQNIQKLKEMNPVNLKVAVQPGCHLLHKTAEFKEVVSSIPGIELIDLPIGCCGKMVEGISGPPAGNITAYPIFMKGVALPQRAQQNIAATTTNIGFVKILFF